MVSVLRTAAVLDHELNDALKPHGLTLTQYSVLRIPAGRRRERALRARGGGGAHLLGA